MNSAEVVQTCSLNGIAMEFSASPPTSLMTVNTEKLGKVPKRGVEEETKGRGCATRFKQLANICNSALKEFSVNGVNREFAYCGLRNCSIRFVRGSVCCCFG